MKRRWLLAVAAIVGCGNTYGAQPDPAGDAGVDASDAGTSPDASVPASDGGGTETGADAGTDADADAGETIPFASFLVLRFETDAPNGLSSTARGATCRRPGAS
jgi:hypothetical protein